MDPRPVALVTGAARRLGRAIALDLAAHGWDVAVHYRGSAAEAEATVGDTRALTPRHAAFASHTSDETAASARLAPGATTVGSLPAPPPTTQGYV